MGPLISGKSRLAKYYNLARFIPSLKLTAKAPENGGFQVPFGKIGEP